MPEHLLKTVIEAWQNVKRAEQKREEKFVEWNTSIEVHARANDLFNDALNDYLNQQSQLLEGPCTKP